MNIRFVVPPAAQSVGGLDAAVESLRAALIAAGCTVGYELPAPGEDQPDLVHFHGLWQRRYSALAKRCHTQGIPYVVSPHGMLEPWAWRHKWWKKWPYFWLVERLFLKQAASLVATAEAEAAHLRARVPGVPVAVLPLGLTGEAGPAYQAARQALGWSMEETVLLYLSRLHPKKGLHLLLSALATLTVPNRVRLVIVGEGEATYLQSLHALAAALPPLGVAVEWHGAIWGDARWSFFQGADLFCLPTHSENFGLAVLESLQVGTPVLTTYATPWADVLTAPEGYVCHPRIPDVHGALTAFFSAPRISAAAQASLAAKTRQKFAWPNVVPLYVQAYHDAMRR